ncbi:hypothetical protein [Pedobacter duraquae]|uniref:Uncharacterized protein n=1 Tax=Pedobacter duraquae TaxID=425511 RepID=A0A4R6IMH1_9SPHI|nr:hypothetical protein [Pedobacter duraquae]TDO23281.1 hypothetical protein CLV32_2270 [Pedobacter duraquae]
MTAHYFRILLTVFTFSLFTFNSYAQKDYIVTRLKDTIWCKVKNINRSLVEIQEGNKKETSEYPPHQISAVYVAKDTAFFKSMNPSGKQPLFLKLLERGTITLYTTPEKEPYSTPNMHYVIAMGMPMGGTGGGSVTDYYAEKAGQPLTKIKTNDPWKSKKKLTHAFLTLLQDKPIIASRYEERDDFDYKKIRQIVQEYNNTN